MARRRFASLEMYRKCTVIPSLGNNSASGLESRTRSDADVHHKLLMRTGSPVALQHDDLILTRRVSE